MMMIKSSNVKRLTVEGNLYYAQVYFNGDKFYGKAWDDNGIDILATQDFDKPKQVWDSMSQALIGAEILE
jgi:hypothetical protein